MKFRLVGGMHFHGKEVYKRGDIVESDKELDKLLVNKFVRIFDESPASTKSETKQTGRKKSVKYPVDITTVENSSQGIRVLMVAEGRYDVVEEDSKEALNEQPLTLEEKDALIAEL
jgi:hypothetical protein